MHPRRKIHLFGPGDVEKHLSYRTCIDAVRAAMIALSEGSLSQLPRSFLELGDNDRFGIMVGSLGEKEIFGAKLISIFPGNIAKGRPSHLGLVALFDREDGDIVCLIDAGMLTAIRTACASAAATDILARPDASTLAILGYGEQAETHIRAVREVRRIREIRVWGRDKDRQVAFAKRMESEHAVICLTSHDPAAAVDGADIVCTTTAAIEPILHGDMVAPGTHINVVGFAGANGAEVDAELVLRSRYFADSRASVHAEAGEFLVLLRQGSICEDHMIAEIGEVFAGRVIGRRTDDEITLYRSLGHIAQDLAAGRVLLDTARAKDICATLL